jgi:hypothetical protein
MDGKREKRGHTTQFPKSALASARAITTLRDATRITSAPHATTVSATASTKRQIIFIFFFFFFLFL